MGVGVSRSAEPSRSACAGTFRIRRSCRSRGGCSAPRRAAASGTTTGGPEPGAALWREAGIGDVRAHDLRHTVATRLFVVDGWTVPQVQAYLGHVDPTVTLKVYTHVAAESLPRPSDGHLADTQDV